VTAEALHVTLTISGSSGSLPDAVDAPGLAFATSGDANWQAQNGVTYDRVDAAQSGAITHNQQSSLSTTVDGPAAVSFRWEVSSEATYDYLRFFINGVERAQISGTIPWAQKTSPLGPGTNTLEWRYTKDYVVNSGLDAGFVDEVSVTGGVPSLFSVTPSLLSVASTSGYEAAQSSFNISTLNGASLDYTVIDDAPWMTVSPTTGDVSGETDTIDISFQTASLAPGNYVGQILVSAPSVQTETVTVNLTVNASNVVPATLDYAQPFDSLPAQADGWVFLSSTEGRIRALAGELALDGSIDGVRHSLNEAVLHIDLAAASNVQLSFDHRHTELGALCGGSPVFQNFALLSGWVPVVACMMGQGFAGPTNYAALADFVLMVRGMATMGMAGPALVRPGTGQDVGKEELGGAARQADRQGIADLAVDSEEERHLNALATHLPRSASRCPRGVRCHPVRH
jgi:hypothetical protein